MGEQKTKALLASGVALFVTGLVVLALFVLPAARHTQVAMAQPEGEEAPGAEDAPGAEMGGDGMGPGGEMGFGGGMPGGGAAAAAAPAAASDPLEPSRTNPFGPRAAGGITEAAAASGATTYGPNWSDLPIGESMGFMRPEIPDAATPPTPVIRAGGEGAIRVTSILWDASGQAQAAYETDEGRSGVLKPGDRIQGNTVIEITRTGVKLQNQRTGASQTLELRSRSSRSSSSGGSSGGGRAPRGFPGAPPG